MPQFVGEVFATLRIEADQATSEIKKSLGAAGVEGGRALDRSLSNQVQEIANKGTRAGRQLTFGLTLPLIGFGHAATESFTTFETSMTRINALVGVSRDQTDAWSSEVQDIGNQFGLTAAEAAEGLYFITSSGIESAEAMEVLKVAAMGAGAGLGTVQSVADVITSAMNAYGAANLSAAKAGDILTIAVREGKAEADQMAGALGRVIPVAAGLGISFEEVAGMAASLTLVGNSADEAATQITAILSQLSDLPPISQRALKAYTGIEYGQLRADLRAKGLRQTLQEVTAAFNGNEAAMSEVFGNIRALRGVMGTFGQTAEQTTDIIHKMSTETNVLGAAWETTAQSPAKQLEIAMAQLNNAMVEIGAAVVPVFTTVAQAAAGIAEGFGALPGPLQNSVVALGLAAAAAGPLVYSFSSLANVVRVGVDVAGKASPGFARLTNHIQNIHISADQATRTGHGLIGKIGGMGQAVGGMSAVIGGAVAVYAIWNARMEESKRKAAELGAVFQKAAGKGGIGAAEDTIGRTRGQIEELGRALDDSPQWQLWDEDYRNDLRASREELERNVEATEKQIAMARSMAAALDLDRDALYDWLTEQKAAGTTYASTKDAIAAYREELEKSAPAAVEVAQATNEAANSFSAVAQAVKSSSDAFFGAFDAEKKLQDAREGIADARRKVTDAERGYQDAIRATEDAERRVADAQRKAVDATRNLTDARTTLADAQQRLNDLMRGPTEETAIGVESAEIALAEAQERLATGKFDSALDRRRAELDVRRALLDLERARSEHARQLADATNEVAAAQNGVADAERGLEDARRGIEEAERAREDARQKQAESLDKIREATNDVAEAEKALITPAMEAATAQSALNDMFRTGQFQTQGMIDHLIALRDMYPDLTGALQPYIDKLYEMQRAAEAPPTPGAFRPEDLGDNWERPNGRAIGGPVDAGSLYRVNERQVPELFEANGRQYLIPLSAGSVKPLAAGLPVRGGDGPAVQVGDIYVTGASSPVATAYELRRQLRSKPGLAGTRR